MQCRYAPYKYGQTGLFGDVGKEITVMQCNAMPYHARSDEEGNCNARTHAALGRVALRYVKQD